MFVLSLGVLGFELRMTGIMDTEPVNDQVDPLNEDITCVTFMLDGKHFRVCLFPPLPIVVIGEWKSRGAGTKKLTAVQSLAKSFL